MDNTTEREQIVAKVADEMMTSCLPPKAFRKGPINIGNISKPLLNTAARLMPLNAVSISRSPTDG